MSVRKLVTVQPECTDEQCRLLKQMKAGVAIEMARMHKTRALLIAVQFAANHEADFVVSDALAVILPRFEQHITILDNLWTEAAS
jgi:hypothetical protein